MRDVANRAEYIVKTVIARFTELKKDPSEIGEVDGEVVDANKIETALRSVGVALRDSNGEFRDFDDVILELSGKWDSLDVNTQRYIATIAAGSRQQSRFIALMSNNARLTQLTTAANSAAGASQKQYEKTLESLETKLNRLKNAVNEFLTTIGNSDVIKGVVDMLTGLINILNKATSWGPRWVQMFTKTAAAIGLFVGLKKVAESGLAKISATMGLQGTQAGNAFVKGYEGAATTGMTKAFAKIGALTKGKSFKQGVTNLWSQAINGNVVNMGGLKADTTELFGRMKGMSNDQIYQEAVDIGKKNGMTDKDAEKFAMSIGRAAKAADDLTEEHMRLAIQEKKNNLINQESVKNEMKELLVNDKLTDAKKKEILVTQYGVKTETAEAMVNESASLAESGETTENIKAKLAESLETKENYKAAVSEAVETKSNNGAASQNSINGMFNKKGQTGVLGKNKGGDVTSGGLKNTFQNFSSKIKTFAKGPGGAVAGGLAVVAAFTAAAYGISKLIDASVVTADEKLEELTERQQDYADTAEAAQSRLAGVTSTISDMEALKEEISGLDKGTAEWTSKVFELNSAMNDVISQYGELADEKYMQTDANGVMSLTEEGQERYAELAKQDALEAQQQNLLAQRRTMSLQRESAKQATFDTEALSKAEEDAATWATTGITAGAALTGMAIGGATISWSGPGAAIGAAIGGVVGLVGGAVASYAIKEGYELTDATLEDAIDKANEEGFSATGKTDAEIDEFLRGVNGTSQELEILRKFMQESAAEFDNLTSQMRELDVQLETTLKQEAALEAQEQGLERGAAERFQEAYVEIGKEAKDGREKRIEKIMKEMDKKQDYGAGKFTFNKDRAELYKEFADAMGYTYTGRKSDPFQDAEGNSIDMSKWSDKEIAEVVAGVRYQNELGDQAAEEAEKREKEIREDNNSIYNLLGSRLGVGKQEWLYDLTEAQINSFNDQLNQVAIQGGDADAYADSIMNIANSAVAAGMDMADVMDILASQSVETKADFWNLKDSLEAAAEAQGVLGFEIETSLIDAAIEAADAVGNIDLNKLAEGAETIKDLIDSFGRTTNRVVSAEELKGLQGLGLRPDQYQMRDDGSAVITDPNWQFGLTDSIANAAIEDVETIYTNNSNLQQIINATKQFSGDISGRKKINQDWFSSELSSDIDAATVAQWGETQVPEGSPVKPQKFALDWKSNISLQQMLSTKAGKEYLSRVFESSNLVYNDNASELVDKIIASGQDINELDVSLLEGGNYLSGYDTDGWEAFKQLLTNGLKTFSVEFDTKEAYEYQGMSLEDFVNNLEDQTNSNAYEILQEVYGDIIEERGIEVSVDNAKGILKQFYEESTQDAIEIAKQSAEQIQSYYESSLLGQEALNDSQKRDSDSEKILANAALDSLDTMVYQIEGAEIQMASFANQVSASVTTIKALTIENYKAAKSIDGLVADLNEYSDALDTPGTIKYNKALSEISQSIIGMGWAKTSGEAQAFFQTHREGFSAIMKGGQGAQEAYESMAKEAALAKIDSEGLDQSWKGLLQDSKLLNLEVDEAIDLGNDTIIKQLLSSNDEENLQLLSKIYEAAGFSVVFDMENDTFLATRNSVDGSGSEREEQAKWLNPYDKFHNLLQDINAELRTRTKLERELNKLTNNESKIGDTESIKRNIQDQIDSANRSIYMNQTLQEGRKEQLKEYMDIGGEKGWSDYAIWDEETNTVRIDWDALNAVSNNWTEEYGQEFEEWVSQMQEWSDEIANLDETIAEDNDLKQELLKFGRDEYMELEQRVYDAIISREQSLIDGMKTVADSIGEANNGLLDGLQKSINKVRQQRQNQETEKEISDQEQQLAYLSQSTTADPLEIMKLEEQIVDARQNYTDQLIDQKISELQEQNEQAANQREKQIAIAQAQLDYNEEHGIYWKETAETLSTGIGVNGTVLTNSNMANLLANKDNLKGMSALQQEQWGADLAKLSEKAKVFMDGGLEDRPATGQDIVGLQADINKGFTNQNSMIDYNKIYEAVKAGIGGTDFDSNNYIDPGFQSAYISALMNNKTGKYNDQELTWENYAKNFSSEGAARQNLMTAMELAGYSANEIHQSVKLNGDKSIMSAEVRKDIRDRAYFSDGYLDQATYAEQQKQQSQDEYDKENFPFNYATEHNSLVDKEVEVSGNNQKWRMDNWNTKNNTINPQHSGSGKFTDYQYGTMIKIKQAVMDPKGNIWIRPEGKKEWISWEGVTPNYRSANEELVESFKKEYNSWTQFKTGGLADFTGPAWLDGTKSAPEIVLNAQDTRNFLQLRDILSDLFRGGNFDRDGSSGDNYYDIDINVDEISSDYDVDQLAALIKQQIVQDSMYRNVNSINFMR